MPASPAMTTCRPRIAAKAAKMQKHEANRRLREYAGLVKDAERARVAEELEERKEVMENRIKEKELLAVRMGWDKIDLSGRGLLEVPEEEVYWFRQPKEPGSVEEGAKDLASVLVIDFSHNRLARIPGDEFWFRTDKLQLLCVDYNELEAQLPEGADLVWLKPDEAPTGQLLKRFKSAATGLWSGLQENQRFVNERDVYLYKFDKRCNWAGTPSYMMTRKGVQTIMKFIEEAEMADMIDAWLSKHCISHCDDPKVCMNLNCYFATVQKVQKEKQGGYVPSWYDEQDDERVREVDARIVKAMNDASKYNVLGCRHGNYNGFVPTSFLGAWGITDENSVADCYHTPQDGTYDFCDPKLHLPIGKSRAESTLGGGETDGGVRKTIMGWYERGFKMRMALLNRPVN